MQFLFHANQSRFHKNGFALRLALKQRHKRTRKWPMNSVFVNPGIYSCAVDAFLEISTPLFLPYLSNLRIRNEFTDLLFNGCSHYMSSREDSSFLSEFASLFGRTSLTFVVHSRLGIVMPVLARYLRKEHLVILMKRK